MTAENLKAEMSKYPSDAKIVANKILLAAGSGLRHYTPQNQEKIIAAVQEFMEADSEKYQSWHPISHVPRHYDLLWFAKQEGQTWIIDGPRLSSYDDVDYWQFWAKCECPQLPRLPHCDEAKSSK